MRPGASAAASSSPRRSSSSRSPRRKENPQMRDLASNIKVVQTVAPAVLTATTKGAAIDLLGFNSAAIVVNTGAIVGAGNFTPKLQESDTTTDGDFTDVAASDLIGSFPSALTASSTVKQSYTGSKR